MSYETNPYYKPEALGLRIAASLEAPRSYEFDMVVVWEDLSSGTLFWAADSGCSCPSPFESHDRSTITELTSEGWADFKEAVDDCDTDGNGASFDAERGEFLGKVSGLLAAFENRKRLSLPGVDPRVAELTTRLSDTTKELDAAMAAKAVLQKDFDTLKNGVMQQTAMVDALRDLYRQLNAWFGENTVAFKVNKAGK